MRWGVEVETSGEGAQRRETEFIETIRRQVVLTRLDRLATFGGGVLQEQSELLSKWIRCGELTAGISTAQRGNRVWIGGWEGRGVRSRSIRTDRPDDVQVRGL